MAPYHILIVIISSVIPENLVLLTKSEQSGPKSAHICPTNRDNHRIQVFELDGKFVEKFGTNGSQLGEFKEPFSVAVLSNDQIVVSDKTNHRIQIFQ